MKIKSVIDSIDFKDKWVRMIIAGIILVVLFIIFFTPRNEISKVNAISDKEPPAEIATDVEWMYSDSARIKAKLNTPKMIRYVNAIDPTIVMPNGLKVLFYDKNMNVNSTLTARYGIRYVRKNITIVRGDVVIVNIQGDTINTEELIWKENEDSVKSDKFIKVREKNDILLAEGFRSDLSFTHYKFMKPKGTIYLDNQGKK